MGLLEKLIYVGGLMYLGFWLMVLFAFLSVVGVGVVTALVLLA